MDLRPTRIVSSIGIKQCSSIENCEAGLAQIWIGSFS
jgi:hypothetical protein